MNKHTPHLEVVLATRDHFLLVVLSHIEGAAHSTDILR